MPQFYGASGIGIGSSVRQKNGIFGMAHYLSQVKGSLVNTDVIQHNNAINQKKISLSTFERFV